MTITFLPARASAVARLDDVRVLPVPPFGRGLRSAGCPSPLGPQPWPGAGPPPCSSTKRSCSFVCGKSAMSAAPASNARRRNPFGDDVDEDDDRQFRRRAMRAVDDLERPIVLTPLAGDEEDVDLAALQRPNGVVDAVGDADELEMRVVGRARCTSKASSPSTATSARIRVSATSELPRLPVSLGLVEKRLHRHRQRRCLLGADLRSQEEPESSRIRRVRELLGKRRSSLEDVRRGLARHRRAEDLDIRREKRQEQSSPWMSPT